MKPKIIAYYLPQFHPIPENDKWWGKGFTEWTNVGKAKPLFKGHQQPKVPADLGYYDLRLSEIREEQAKLAKEAGIHAFCYWHYWLGNGKRLLEMPFNEVLRTGKPDFPFCLGWANHNWAKKQWNSDVSRRNNEMLIKQEYPGKEDYVNHFYSNLEAFRDKRYVRIDNKPFFLIYDVEKLPDAAEFIKIWNELAYKNGLGKFYFVSHTRKIDNIDFFLQKGFDAVNFSPHRIPFGNMRTITSRIKRIILKIPNVVSYSKAIKTFDHPLNYKEFIIPTIIPNWDHTPRSGASGIVLHNSNPKLFKIHVDSVLKSVQEKEVQNQIIMIKSWNEWGEGNYMEPDLKYGKSYLDILSYSIKKF